MRTRCTWNAKLHRGMHESVLVRRIRCPWLSYSGASHGLSEMYSSIYYAVPRIPLHSFAAQEMNRRARATSNDWLCMRRMCQPIHIYVLHVYIYTYTHATGACWSAIVHGLSFNFLFHACPRLDTHRTCLSTENSPCAYHLIHYPYRRFHPDSTDAIPTSCVAYVAPVQSSNWSPETSTIYIYDGSRPLPTSIELHLCGDCVTILPLVRRKSSRQKTILIRRIINKKKNRCHISAKHYPVHLTINDKYVIIKRTDRQYRWSHAT